MKRIFIITVLSLLMVGNVISQKNSADWIWAKGFGGSLEDIGKCFTIDKDGYIYLAGSFMSTNLLFGNTLLKNQYAGVYDMYIVKFDPNWKVIWAKSYGGNGTDELASIDVDAMNNIYITGRYTSSTIKFDNQTITKSPNSNYNGFLVKMNLNGNVIFAKNQSGSDVMTAKVLIDKEWNVCLSGYYSGSVIFDKDTLKSNGGGDNFLVKLDRNGKYKWSRTIGGTQKDYPIWSLAVDESCNLYINGAFASKTIDVGNKIIISHHGGTGNDVFLVKYDKNGKSLWAKSIGGIGDDFTPSVITDKKQNVYITGYYKSSILNIDSTAVLNNYVGGEEVFLIKLDKNGKKVYVKTYGGIGNDCGKNLSVDNNDNLYLTGYFDSQTITFDTITLNRKSSKDAFTVKFDNNGNALWAKCSGGNPYGILTDEIGNTYISGYYSDNSINFDNIVVKQQFPGSFDAYVAKISESNRNNKIFGNIFLDVNKNGKKDSLENLIPGAFFVFDQYYITPDVKGNYTAFLDTGSHIIKPIFPGIFKNILASFPPTDTIIFKGYGGFDTVKTFAVQKIGDTTILNVTLTNVTRVRPGFNFNYNIAYENNGTDIINGKIRMKFDTLHLKFKPKAKQVFKQIKDTLEFNFVGLLPFEKRFFTAEFRVDSTTKLGTKIKSMAIIIPNNKDSITCSKKDTIEIVVVGSFDPNDKDVSPKGVDGKTPIDTKSLLYTIRFQNTGTDTAFNVYVRDTLSSYFDLSTLKILSASHEYRYVINNRVLTVYFDKILLPDSNVNEKASNGFFKYSVSFNSGMKLGDEITNNGYIYFDYNQPVKTNTTYNKLVLLQSINNKLIIGNKTSDLIVYPNPSKDIYNIIYTSDKSKTITVLITNSLGQIIFNKEVEVSNGKNILNADIKSHSKGIYLLKIMSDNEVKITNIIKE